MLNVITAFYHIIIINQYDAKRFAAAVYYALVCVLIALLL